MQPLRRFVVAVMTAAVLPRLAHRGMFVDGVTYASIARNLAEGRGTFWEPSYTATIYPRFFEHPPLGFWLQSLWFRVFGDHLFVERACAAVAALVTAALIALIWRTLNATTSEKNYGWLPVLLWIAVPIVSWAVVGNLLEVTVSVFTTLAVACVVFAALSTSTAAAVGWGIASGLAVIGAFLTKGPVGLFPLAAPVLLAAIPASRPGSAYRRPAVTLAGQWAVAALGMAALLSMPLARSSLGQYWNQQVVAALSGGREVSASSFIILKMLLQAVLLPMTLAMLVVSAAARTWVLPSNKRRTQAWSFLLLALAGTLPIVASPKQAGHYLVPAVPFYALAAASLLVDTLRVGIERIDPRRLSRVVDAATLALLVVAIAGAVWPPIGRDRQRIAAIDGIDGQMPHHATIGICPEVNSDWGLHAWFERRFAVSLDAREEARHEWFLGVAARARPGCPPARCKPIGDATRELVLMKCSQTAEGVER